MIKNTVRFLKEFSEIAPKFEWYLYTKKYTVRGNPVVLKEIRGILKGGDELKEFIPITALVHASTGQYFEMDRFDLAAVDIHMSPECASQVVDACDDWPDRLHGYNPKPHETKLREDILGICMGSK